MKYVYDRAGHLARYTDPLGPSTRYELDAHGNLVKTTDALGRVRSFTYDKVGNLTRQLDAKSLATQSAYDALNRRTQTTNPIGGVHTTRYDLKHAKANGSLLRTTTQTWDANDNFVAWSDTDASCPRGQQTASATLSYDDANRKTGETVSYLRQPEQEN